MTLHQRKTIAESPSQKQDEEHATRPCNNGSDNADVVDSKKGKIVSPSTSKWMPRRRSILAALVLLQLLAVAFAVYKTKIESFSHGMAIMTSSAIASFPIILALACGLGVDSSPPHQPHQIVIPLAVVATIVGNQLPAYFTSGFTVAAMILFGLISRPVVTTATTTTSTNTSTTKNETSNQRNASFRSRKHHPQAGPLAAVAAATAMTTVLLVENFCVWIVSATYYPSQQLVTLPTPLQDNGKIVLRYLFDTILKLNNVVKLRNVINVQWALVTGLGLSLGATVVNGVRMRRTLWGIAVRSLSTMAIARFIRTTSFLITVLPSQNQKCYFSHFPYPPPEDWMSWIMVGFTPQSHGGCNDLIISGHATVTATLACLTTSVVGKPLFTTALWMLVSMDYMVEVYEGFHYSVDMWLGGESRFVFQQKWFLWFDVACGTVTNSQ
jgi:PAP2 superfamily C-terminal